jgi:cell division protein FtsI (penicillin-binding protein 3)
MLLRLKISILLGLFAFSLLLLRLFYWQVYKGSELSIQARGQQQSGYTLSAPRGDILAADGSWLAASVEAWLVFANPSELSEDASSIADKLAGIFVEESEKDALLKEAGRIKELLARNNLVWVSIKQKINSETKEKIEALGIRGVGFERQEGRYYPEASVAAHLLGFVGKNKEGGDQGYSGLEGYYDMVLSGKPGYIMREKDALGLPIAVGKSREIAAVGGVDLLTYIDKGVELNLDSKLLEGIQKYGASGGTAIVMDPKTGGIIAMSSYPSYDPQRYYDFGDRFFVNPAISLSFEPGSVFKVLVMAAALDAGVVRPETKCDICSGPVRINKYTIQTWNKEYRPDSSMIEVIVNSDNVGMVFVGQKLGIEKMYDYLASFGISDKTGIDLQGEMSPVLRKKENWGLIDLATASFGQGVAVTPIQLIRAVGAIANKGVIVHPRVVDKIIGEGWEEDIKTEPGKRVISEKAAREITSMMAEAAQRGESKWTNIGGFRVAGKTGTAQIPIAGHYDAEKTIASFIGFAPYDDPKFVMLVTLHEPTSSPWASETAAPLWYSIARDLFVRYGIQP